MSNFKAFYKKSRIILTWTQNLKECSKKNEIIYLYCIYKRFSQ